MSRKVLSTLVRHVLQAIRPSLDPTRVKGWHPAEAQGCGNMACFPTESQGTWGLGGAGRGPAQDRVPRLLLSWTQTRRKCHHSFREDGPSQGLPMKTWREPQKSPKQELTALHLECSPEPARMRCVREPWKRGKAVASRSPDWSPGCWC